MIRLSLAISVFLIALSSPTIGHDIWINQQGLRNAVGEWCCGEGDCFVISSNDVRTEAFGYVLMGAWQNENVPYSEACLSG